MSCPVTDMDRAVIFYRDVLGLRLLFQQQDWSEFDIDGQRLALHRESMPETQNSGRVIVSFEARPIESITASLKAMGVRFSGEIAVYSYGKQAYFTDPDGNTLGLYEPPEK